MNQGNKGYLKEQLISPTKVIVAKSPTGYGVFAIEPIKEGEIIQECVIMSDTLNEEAGLESYRFKGPKINETQYYHIIGGLACIVNHSREKANTSVQQDHRYERVARIYALRDIEQGEELLWNYGYQPKG